MKLGNYGSIIILRWLKAMQGVCAYACTTMSLLNLFDSFASDLEDSPRKSAKGNAIVSMFRLAFTIRTRCPVKEFIIKLGRKFIIRFARIADSCPESTTICICRYEFSWEERFCWEVDRLCSRGNVLADVCSLKCLLIFGVETSMR